MTAAHIVNALLENDADIDPKEYALNSANPKWVYHNIVFFQGDEAAEVLDILEQEGEAAALEHAKQWDYGAENEHSPQMDKPWASGDSVYTADAGGGSTYFLTWNSGMGYIGLTRGKRHIYGVPD